MDASGPRIAQVYADDHRIFSVWALRSSRGAVPAMAGAKTFENAKLDETLRESIERGCVGTQSVIITVTPGYREGLRRALASTAIP